VNWHSSGSKPALATYLLALLVVGAGLIVTLALLAVSDEAIYAPLLGALVLVAWTAGIGPSVVGLVFGWGLALWLVVAPRGSFGMREEDDFVRWCINLGVAVLIVIAAATLRVGRQRATTRAIDATALGHETERLVLVTTALSAAVSSADVARVLSVQGSDLIGAQGGALGLIEASDLVVVDPTGLAAEARTDGDRVPLDRATLLTQAAREATVAIARDRATFESMYHDSADTLTSDVEGAIAIPVRSEGKVVGSIGFLFDRSHPITENTEALANVLGGLAGQALERTRLYERERESRQALERILQVAPRFLRDDADDVIQAICREARSTFGADYGVLWRIRTDELELLAMDPPRADLEPGMLLPLEDFPRLREAISAFGTSFVADVLQTTYGRGLEFVRALGIRSSLRTPVVIAGASELVLSISWEVVISEPEPATRAVVRRFADQAGLALEQMERRRAEADAAVRADATRRLQDVTAALSRASTRLDVSNTCLEHALESIGAEAGFVVLAGPDGTAVEIISSSGYDDDELETWRSVGRDADVPFARAMASGEPVWALTAEDMSAFAGVAEPRSAGWVTIPLMTRAGAVGALHVSLRSPRVLSEAERDWLLTMVTQCSQAVERSGLYEEEQALRRRAERLQSMTASLSNALTTADVARVFVDEVGEAIDADDVGLAAIGDEGHTAEVLAWYGDHEEEIASLLGCRRADSGTPTTWTIRARRSALFESGATLEREFPAVRDEVARSSQETFFFVPLVAARRTNAVLLVTWKEHHRLSADERSFVEVLAAQAAQALDRARLFESEQTIAETLQRSVLPVALPRVEGVQLAARYLPGSAELDVGGDWFDALRLPGGRVGLVVGDVVGKGVQAAASMAQLRNAIRAFSVEPLRPSSALARLNRLAEEALDTTFATLVYLVLDPQAGVCRMSSAGHPPPVVAYADGRVELLEGGRGLPLGTGIESKYRQETVRLPAGSTLVLYTDGLVERRGRSIDEGLADLRAAIATAPRDPDRLLEHVLDRLVGSSERGDDIALLAARLLVVAPRELDLRVPAEPGSMDVIRDAMRTWLGGAPIGRADAEDVVLATWEACANAIEHAVEPTNRTLTLRASLEDSRIRIVVRDTGTWAPHSTRPDRGLGLRLMRGLSSSVDIVQSDEGTTVTVEKALAPADTV
jgi:serine phosphatase RsbU (regulator of sigma subunit)/anti-sigma regulatory factor (Ser/Thr protein kinase)